MVKFVFDADGAIKLAHAGVLSVLATQTVCIMPQAAYNEVMKGKEHMYEDAFIIEALVEGKKLSIVKAVASNHTNIGLCERSVITAFHKYRADVIVSDDAKFLSILEQEHTAFITPTDIIVWLVIHNRLSVQESLAALEKIRPFVRQSAYENALKTIQR